MFIAIILIILGACISVVWSMYFNTITMLKTYGSVNGYYWAYYWAMASIERWLLMSKIKYPTYEWFWWFKWEQIYWAPSNWFSGDFWKLAQWRNSMTRSVNSRTQIISWVINTKVLREISFNKYADDDPDSFNWWVLSWKYWIEDWLFFTGETHPRTYNIWDISKISSWRWESTDFNRFFSLKNKDYIVRWLNTTDTYGQLNEVFDAEWEKDFQLWQDFNFDGDACNPRPALSGLLDYDYYNCD